VVERFLLIHVPTFWLAIGMVVVSVALSLLGLAVVRRSVELNKLTSQHEVAGFLIAVVGVIYAVLLAFVVVIQWEQFSAADNDARAEATAVGNLYRDGVAVGGRPGGALETAVSTYAGYVATREWPYMAAHLDEAEGTDKYLNAVWKAVTHLPSANGVDAAVLSQAVGDVSTASEARRTRIEESHNQLPGPLWAALLIGGVITVSFTYFFGLMPKRPWSPRLRS
jgi:Protein of unknown function (DUF4239)